MGWAVLVPSGSSPCLVSSCGSGVLQLGGFAGWRVLAPLEMRYVMCRPTLSPPGLGTCEQSWGELAQPPLPLA